jgi:hypothetical protein
MTTNIEQTGAFGEKLVLKYLSTLNEYSKVYLSDNVYDMHKDIVAESNTGKSLKVECKTRTVIRKYCAMPLERSQWYKADNCDKLFFISNPTSLDEPISIYESTGDDYFVVQEFGPRKAETRMYDLTKMKKVCTVSDQSVIDKMYKLSISTYKQ